MTCNLNQVNVNFLVNVNFWVNANLFLVIFNQVNVDKKVNVYLGMSGNSLESDTFKSSAILSSIEHVPLIAI